MQTANGIPTALCPTCVRPLAHVSDTNTTITNDPCQGHGTDSKMRLREAIRRAEATRKITLRQTALGVETELCEECVRPVSGNGLHNPFTASLCLCHNRGAQAERDTAQNNTMRNGSIGDEAEGRRELHDWLSGDEIQPTRCQQMVCLGKGTDVWQCELCGFMAHQRCIPRHEWPTITSTGFRCHMCMKAGTHIPDQTRHLAEGTPYADPGTRPANSGQARVPHSTPSKFQSLPTFAGTVTEDPQAFLEDCADRLTRYGVCTEEWASCIGEQLTGNARQWYHAVARYGMKWSEFLAAFRLMFTNTFASLQARSQAVLQTQTREETLTAFATRKMTLLRQHHPGMAPTEVLEVIAATARPEYRSGLAPLIHSNYADFMRSVLLMDSHSSEEETDKYSRPKRTLSTPEGPVRETEKRAPPQQQHQQLSRREATGSNRRPDTRDEGRSEDRRGWDAAKPPPYACRICPGREMHWHKDCPNNPDNKKRGNLPVTQPGNGGQG